MSDLLCPTCQTPYRMDQMVCNKCGQLLFDPRNSTVHVRVDPALVRLRRKRAVGGGPLDLAPQKPGFMVCLQIRGLNERLYFEDSTDIVLGRLDLTNPDLSRFDLSRFGGHERGVSREHCLMRYQDGALTVTDLGSVNGTRLNLERLAANEPRTLKDGDSLVLGSLTITIRFEGSSETPPTDNPPAPNMVDDVSVTTPPTEETKRPDDTDPTPLGNLSGESI